MGKNEPEKTRIKEEVNDMVIKGMDIADACKHVAVQNLSLYEAAVLWAEMNLHSGNTYHILGTQNNINYWNLATGAVTDVLPELEIVL